MTVSASADYEFTIDRIVLHALRLANVMGMDEQPSGVQWNNRAVVAREQLEMLVKALEAEGRLVRARRFYELTVAAGTSDYTMPADIMDIYGDAAFIGPDAGDPPTSEYTVRQVGMEAWQAIGSRAAEGVPSVYFAYRASSQIEIRLWPTPATAEDEGTVRFQAYYLLANNTNGSNTADLERHWALYLTTALAAQMAEMAGMPREKVGGLDAKAQYLLQRAKAYSRQRTNNQAMVAHPGPWR